MADEEPATPSESTSEEQISVAFPTREPLPPPPDVTYTRPELPGQRRVSPSVSVSGHHEDDSSPALKLGGGLAAATTFVASVVAGFLIGQWIDHHWNHGGGFAWGTIIFSLIGVAAGFLNLFRVLAATDRSQKKK